MEKEIKKFIKRLINLSKFQLMLWRLRLLRMFGQVLEVFSLSGGQKKARTSKRFTPDLRSHPSGDLPDHPIIEMLSQRALIEIFEYYDLIYVPGRVFELLKEFKNPMVAFRKFAISVGCDLELIRNKTPGEIHKLQTAVDLLIAFEEITKTLSPQQRHDFQDLIFVGEYDTVRGYAKTLQAMRAVLGTRDRIKGLAWFATYKDFISDIEKYEYKPLALPPDDAEEAKMVSAYFETFIVEFQPLKASFDDDSAFIAVNWPDAAPDKLRDATDALFIDIQASIDALLGNPRLFIDDPAADTGWDWATDPRSNFINGQMHKLRESRVLLDEIIKMAFEAADEDGKKTSGGGKGSGRSKGSGSSKGGKKKSSGGSTSAPTLDDALVFFGFKLGERPDHKTCKRAFRNMLMRYHPDLAASDPDGPSMDERNHMTLLATDHFDLIKRKMGWS